ncbi:MAG TPA: hypothetical protein PKI80_03755 [Deltaproteobacteria bacterium]|nr:hypothetical protein [Deltaproteobacteria bacterium]
MAGWNDAPHLTPEMKATIAAGIPPYQLKARSEGIPMLGAGAIFPISEDSITCEPFTIPRTWPRAYGMDVGWNSTACAWGAWDTEGDILYLYNEYKVGKEPPAIHTTAIKARGNWIPGVIDPHSDDSGQRDGAKLLEEYRDLGLDLQKANNSVEAGLLEMWRRFTEGRLVVFSSLVAWFGEFRIYHRDENGKIVKVNDHLMDATRYLVMSGADVAISEATARAVIYRRAPRHQPGDMRMGY